MNGVLADVNVQGHLPYLTQRLRSLAEWEIVNQEPHLAFVTFRDLGLNPRMEDRALWEYCQANGWVLFTEDRNKDGPNSIESALNDSWRTGCLPVLTLANKDRFERSSEYADRVAKALAEILFDIRYYKICDQPRIYLPQ